MLLPAIGTQEKSIRDSDVSTNEPSRYARAVAALLGSPLGGEYTVNCVLRVQQLKAHTLLSTVTRANNRNQARVGFVDAHKSLRGLGVNPRTLRQA
jgi:hypothetical protein